MNSSRLIPFLGVTLFVAGVYNLAWGTWVILFPNMMFEMLDLELPRYPQIWQCVGMIVGVYGVGYVIAGFNPLRHWPIVLVGFLGKVFGPIGMWISVQQGTLPATFAWVNVFNDLIWWFPFGLILYLAAREDSDRDQTQHAS